MARLKEVTYFNNWELKHMLMGKMLELLIDTIGDKVYHVAPLVGHAKAAAHFLKIKEEKINKLNAGHLVSAAVTIEKKVVKEILIGASSLEINHRHLHTKYQLEKAKRIVEKIMNLSEQLDKVRIVQDIKKHEKVYNF